MISSYLIESYYVFNGLIKKIVDEQPNLSVEQRKELRANLKRLNNKELVAYYNSLGINAGYSNQRNEEDEKSENEAEGSSE